MRSGPAASRALSLSANPAQATGPTKPIRASPFEGGFHLTLDSQSPMPDVRSPALFDGQSFSDLGCNGLSPHFVRPWSQSPLGSISTRSGTVPKPGTYGQQYSCVFARPETAESVEHGRP